MIRAAAVQNHPVFGETENNLSAAEALVRSTSADLYVLPELFSTGYLFRDREELAAFAEEYPEGRTCRFLQDLSDSIGVVIAGGFAEKSPDGSLYNSGAVFDRGKPLACYRKIHLFDIEWDLFEAGEAPPEAIDSSCGRLGPLICFDWFFPETTRCLALDGAQTLVHMANLVMPYCQNAMVTRCLENGVYAVTANRIGREERGGLEIGFTGGSQITGKRGERLAQATANREEVLVVEIDPALADQKDVNPRNNILRDRRPGLYKRLVE